MNSNHIVLDSVYFRYRESLYQDEVHVKQYVNGLIAEELFSLRINESGNIVEVCAELKDQLIVELFSVGLKIKKEGAVQCLNRYRRVQDVSSAVWNNNLTLLHVRYQHNGKNYLLSNTQAWFSYNVKDEGEHLSFTIYLDAAAMHPAWSHRESTRKADSVRMLHSGDQYKLSFSIDEIEATPPVLSRYPLGTEACFIITDHCDYDQADTLQTFLNGWLGKGLKLTKGVFALRSDYAKEGLAATLEDKDYLQLINELHNDGSEIAPHALNQSGQISKDSFDAALHSISETYNCRTWIDHGSYQKYTYSVGGGTNEYRLTDKLKELGFTSLWSYYDAPIDAAQSLNMFSSTPVSYKQVGKNLLRGKLATAGHYLKTILERKNQGNASTLVKLMGAVRKNLLSKTSIKGLIKDIYTVFRYSTRQEQYYTAGELNNFSPVLYSECRQPLYNREENDLLLFATQEVVHTKDAYTAELLNKLVAEKGLHIGHTYLLNTLPYLNGVFDNNKQLSKEWMVFVAALSSAVKSGIMWNPTMHEFVAYTELLVKLNISYPTLRSMRIENKSDKDINGVSFFTNNTHTILWDGIVPDYRTDSAGERTFWGNIPAHASVTITW